MCVKQTERTASGEPILEEFRLQGKDRMCIYGGRFDRRRRTTDHKSRDASSGF